MFRMQGVQCLEQSLKKHGTQEILEFSDGIVCYILWYPCQISDIIYNDFICGPLRPNVGEIDNSTVKGCKRDMTFRNCSTFWYQPPTSVDAITWACCGILPNQDLLQVASTEEESEKDTRLWAGQDPNWPFVTIYFIVRKNPTTDFQSRAYCEDMLRRSMT